MKALVIYDTKYGNTEQVANAIGRTIGADAKCANKVDPQNLKELDLIIIGSPTHAGSYSRGIKELLKKSPDLEGVPAAPFDTSGRSSPFGYGSRRLARRLKKQGGKLAAPPESFYIEGMEGPLADGELGRAMKWAKMIVESM